MTAANAVRGEVGLTLAGRAMVLRPSFERLLAAEAEIGSLFALLDAAASGDIRIRDAEALLWACLEGDRPDRAEFQTMLADAGLPAMLAPYRQLLGQLFGAR